MIYRYLDMDRLSKEPDVGKVLGWVMAANDLAATFYLQKHFHERNENRLLEDFYLGAGLYIDRLMCAQTIEAIAMVEVCKSSALFLRTISTHFEAEISFEKLFKLNQEEFQPGKLEKSELSMILDRNRNKAMFHYYSKRDKKVATWLKKYARQRAEAGQKFGSAILCDSNLFTRYIFVDDVFKRSILSRNFKSGLQRSRHFRIRN